MRGVTSQAMVMCSGSEDRKFFELLDPPEGSVPGDRVTFEGYPGDPDGQLNPKKKVNFFFSVILSFKKRKVEDLLCIRWNFQR